MSILKQILMNEKDEWVLDGRVVPEEIMATGKVTHQPNASWTLDENFEWQPPTPKPDDGKGYMWDEENTEWVEITSGH